ncbi:hypothetical protein ABZV91_18500 [Nocardia sp. NPDC004568]|uniref:hypothetical protein n=1 Tax=Nocardia sp. NPDC004568 TaxID=3154551 RepID=UPI0033AF42C5
MSALVEKFANAFAFTALAHMPGHGLTTDDLTTPAAQESWAGIPTDGWPSTAARRSPMHEKDWPLDDLEPGTYTMTSTGDGPGDAVVTDDGRLLVQQYEGHWRDLTDAYRTPPMSTTGSSAAPETGHSTAGTSPVSAPRAAAVSGGVQGLRGQPEAGPVDRRGGDRARE